MILDLGDDVPEHVDRSGAGEYCPFRIIGPRWNKIAEPAMELLIVSKVRSRSSPERLARAKASAAATMWEATNMFAIYFRRAPVPKAPV